MDGSLRALAQKIKSGGISKIAILTGAGISGASGIPDFRSPGGLYDSLRPDLLSCNEEQRAFLRRDPTGVVMFKIFEQTQFPYLEVRRPFILGTCAKKWRYTISHAFFDILSRKNLLARLYDQNIDGLSNQLSIPSEKIVNPHGSLANIACELCGADYPRDEFHERVKTQIRNIYYTGPSAQSGEVDDAGPAESTNIVCKACARPGIKPKTVMFGRPLPAAFFEAVEVDFPDNVDLLIIAGTSLQVHPAASLVMQVDRSCPRLLINRDRVGEDLGMFSRDTDHFLSGTCDDGFLALCAEAGWLDELQALASGMCANSQATLAAFLHARAAGGDSAGNATVFQAAAATAAAAAEGGGGEGGGGGDQVVDDRFMSQALDKSRTYQQGAEIERAKARAVVGEKNSEMSRMIEEAKAEILSEEQNGKR